MFWVLLGSVMVSAIHWLTNAFLCFVFVAGITCPLNIIGQSMVQNTMQAADDECTTENENIPSLRPNMELMIERGKDSDITVTNSGILPVEVTNQECRNETSGTPCQKDIEPQTATCGDSYQKTIEPQTETCDSYQKAIEPQTETCGDSYQKAIEPQKGEEPQTDTYLNADVEQHNLKDGHQKLLKPWEIKQEPLEYTEQQKESDMIDLKHIKAEPMHPIHHHLKLSTTSEEELGQTQLSLHIKTEPLDSFQELQTATTSGEKIVEFSSSLPVKTESADFFHDLLQVNMDHSVQGESDDFPTVPCQKCGLLFTSAVELLSHELRCMIGDGDANMLSELTLEDIRNIIQFPSQTKPLERKYACPYCPTKVSTVYFLNRHIYQFCKVRQLSMMTSTSDHTVGENMLEEESDEDMDELVTPEMWQNKSTRGFMNYCQYCGKHLLTKMNLLKHMMTCTVKKNKNAKLYQCPGCGLSFVTVYSLACHKRNSISCKKKDNISCQYEVNTSCQMEVNTSYKPKFTNVHKNQCKQCGLTFGCKYSLDFHKKSNYCNYCRCKICGLHISKQIRNLSVHNSCLMSTLLSCNECKVGFAELTNFEKHQSYCVGINYSCTMFRCEDCNVQCTSEEGLERHKCAKKSRKTKSDDTEKLCKMCGKSISALTLSMHDECLLNSLLTCMKCNMGYGTDTDLTDHEVKCQPDMYGPNVYTHSWHSNSDESTKSTTSSCRNDSDSSENYEVSHTQKIKIVCHFCKKKQPEETYEAHQMWCRLHPFKCPKSYCTFRCKSQEDLDKHIRHQSSDAAHQVLRPYKCKECGRSFTRAFHLKQHMRVHTGKKPFKCDICLKKFTHQGACTQHTKVYHQQLHDSYKCPMCFKIIKKQYKKEHEGIHLNNLRCNLITANAENFHSHKGTQPERYRVDLRLANAFPDDSDSDDLEPETTNQINHMDSLDVSVTAKSQIGHQNDQTVSLNMKEAGSSRLVPDQTGSLNMNKTGSSRLVPDHTDSLNLNETEIFRQGPHQTGSLNMNETESSRLSPHYQTSSLDMNKTGTSRLVTDQKGSLNLNETESSRLGPHHQTSSLNMNETENSRQSPHQPFLLEMSAVGNSTELRNVGDKHKYSPNLDSLAVQCEIEDGIPHRLIDLDHNYARLRPIQYVVTQFTDEAS